MNGGIIKIIIKNIMIDDLNLSGIFEFFINILNDFCGPYDSCHNISLFWNIFIIGDEYIDVITDK